MTGGKTPQKLRILGPDPPPTKLRRILNFCQLMACLMNNKIYLFEVSHEMNYGFYYCYLVILWLLDLISMYNLVLFI